MLKVSEIVRTVDEALICRKKITEAIDVSALSAPQKSYLLGAIGETFQLWEAQFRRPSTKAMRSERLFEGDGYRIFIKAQAPNGGIIGTLKRVLRFG